MQFILSSGIGVQGGKNPIHDYVVQLLIEECGVPAASRGRVAMSLLELGLHPFGFGPLEWNRAAGGLAGVGGLWLPDTAHTLGGAGRETAPGPKRSSLVICSYISFLQYML